MQPRTSPTLYAPEFEHDSCGVGFVARIDGERTHAIIEAAMTALGSMVHRGAMDADAKTGDGAGITTQIPYGILKPGVTRRGYRIDKDADLGVGMAFLPRGSKARALARRLVDESVRCQGLIVAGWRNVPVDSSVIGGKAAMTEPHIAQILVIRPDGVDDDEFERRLYLARRQAEHEAALRDIDGVYFPSFSSRTVVYKGLFVGPQIGRYYLDLQDPRYRSALAVFHQRYSTNTFPNWQLAQPLRRIAHNGEINTLRGNEAWMAARARSLDGPAWDGRLSGLGPHLKAHGSDSAKLDNALELYHLSGRCIPHSIMMMLPEAHERTEDMDEDLRGFYRYHACLTEPWDGPAALAFTDGITVGAALDRNGLRPARYSVTDDGLVVMASEAGVLALDDRHVIEKGRLGPGQMIAINTRTHALQRNDDIKREVARLGPYREWADEELQAFGHSDTPEKQPAEGATPLVRRMQSYGYSRESTEVVLTPMVETGKEPIGSMGDDTPLAVLSQSRRWLYSYFKQLFAQVTNPPIDHLREELVMSLRTHVGARGGTLSPTPEAARLVTLETPFLTPGELLRLTSDYPDLLRAETLDAVFQPVPEALEAAVRGLADEAAAAVRAGKNVLVLSHRAVGADRAPIPAMLAVGAVHDRLVREGLRLAASIVADVNDAYEVHHAAMLIATGADVIVPRLAFEIAQDLAASGTVAETTPERAIHNYRHALGEGLLKIMSKMGISTVASYRGARIYEILGLGREITDACFAGAVSRIGGIGFADVARAVLDPHGAAYEEAAADKLAEDGTYRFRKGMEYHAYNPLVFKALHDTARSAETDRYRNYAQLVEGRPPTAIRDCLEFVPTEPVPLDEVESVEEIVRRFVTPAMSLGALSPEAHETLAIAMNMLGAKSNSGEGGEDPARFARRPDGTSANSAIKQVASARFGVTPEYLASARELEIKMAQGSKPGEGGQLPGHKVTPEIARVRHAVPGVTLISPPPHHDIYSIEDLAQLIYDLKHANTRARVAVKLVSEAGIGTIAAGVAKAFADVIHISGHDGGTGASPWSSIKNAGLPWELGLSEAQQVLMLNGLRGRVMLRVDGGMKTGRDVIIAALLGAEEYGFGTASLVASGCVMARQCHLNTCPVGVATQREDLRKKFPGKPEHIVAFMRGVAGHVRELLASLGARSLRDIVGRVDLLRMRQGLPEHVTAGVNFDRVLAVADPTWRAPRFQIWHRNDRGEHSLDDDMLQDARDAVRGRGKASLEYRVTTSHRAVGTKLAGEIAYEHGDAGLPPGAISCLFRGSAGQSFGAFCIDGLRLELHGDANDYVGKGMGGGEIIIRPRKERGFVASENVIIGNTVMYGATGGRLFAAGRAGERFCVRNSGGTAVVEGVGDHGCEYMTGGTAVILGPTGRNFGAGMTGGAAYVLDETNGFPRAFNPQLVDIERITREDDERQLQDLMQQHFDRTGSEKAGAILADWPAWLGRFWKVAPHGMTADQQKNAKARRPRELAVIEAVEGEHPEVRVGTPAHPVETVPAT